MIDVRIESGMETAMIMVLSATAEEEQDHQAGERGGDDGLAHDSVDGGAHEERLVADGLDLEARRKASLDAGQQAEDAFDDARAWRRCRT